MFSSRLMKRLRGVGGGERERGEEKRKVGRAKRRKIDVKRSGKGVKQSVTGLKRNGLFRGVGEVCFRCGAKGKIAAAIPFVFPFRPGTESPVEKMTLLVSPSDLSICSLCRAAFLPVVFLRFYFFYFYFFLFFFFSRARDNDN